MVQEQVPLIQVENMKKYYPVKGGIIPHTTAYIKAVDGVSFSIMQGETLGLVGESGCGKSTIGRQLVGLEEPTEGSIYYKGTNLAKMKNFSRKNGERLRIRTNLQMVFQDSYSSLNPRKHIYEILAQPMLYHQVSTKETVEKDIAKLLDMVGLPMNVLGRYPHEFSGGQRQRICIARALALKPDLVICDEPVSALDVSIQAQIINMLKDLQKELELTYVFISHDLSVVKHISDEVGVMYLGSMVEYGSKEAIFNNTLHPYTKALFSAVPVPNPHIKMNRIILKGDIPSPVNPPKGCKFHTRCEHCMEVCEKVKPIYKEVEEGHFCACHLYNTPEDNEWCKEQIKKAEELERITAIAKDYIKVFKKKDNSAEKTVQNTENTVEQKENNGEEEA